MSFGMYHPRVKLAARFSTLEIQFMFFTPQGGTEKSMNEFREGTYPPLWGVSTLDPSRGTKKISLFTGVWLQKIGIYGLVTEARTSDNSKLKNFQLQMTIPF